jgi:hypothetical protein
MKLRSRNHLEPYLLDKYTPYQGGSAIKSGVRLPGTAGNYISTPDSVLNSITGDIDIRVYVKVDTWAGATASLLSKYDSTGNNRSYRLFLTGGQLSYAWAKDGISASSAIVGASPLFAAGTAAWLRVTHDVDNGAGANDIKFYTSIDGVTWTQLGATQTGAGSTTVTSIFDGTAVLEIGSNNAGTGNVWAGVVYYAEVRNGIDGPIVAKFDSSQVQVSGAQLPATINGWTWNGTALYKRDDYARFTGASGNILSSPRYASPITGDIDLRIKLAADDYTPAASNMRLITRKPTPAATAPWDLYLNSIDGKLHFLWYDGTITQDRALDLMVPTVDGTLTWFRVTLDVDNGSGGNTTTFYRSPDGVTWTVMTNSAVAGSTTGVTQIVEDTNQIYIGATGDGQRNLAGNVYYAEVRNGINGPVVASFNGGDNQVQTPWTINGAAWNWEGASFTGKPGIAYNSPGVASNYISTPDTVANSIVGDIDVRVKLNNPSGAPFLPGLISKWASSSQRSWMLRLGNANNRLEFIWTTDGATQKGGGVSTTAVPVGVSWVRATLVVATGVISYYSSLDGVTWTPNGTVTDTAGAIFDSTSIVTIGNDIESNRPYTGVIYYAEVRNGIDGPIVAKFDPTNIAKQNRVGNLLTPNQADIEIDASGWTAGNATLARSTTQALDGASSLQITATAAATATITMNPALAIPAVAGNRYTAKANFRAATVGRTVQMQINFYTAGGAFISNNGGSGPADSTSGWVETVATFVAPATTGFVIVAPVVIGMGGVGEIHYMDRVSVVELGLPTTTVQPGGTPNGLTPQMASLEDGTTTGWIAVTNATITNTAAQALDGTKSLSLAATAIGASEAGTSNGTSGVPVVPGKQYTARASLRAATTGRATRAYTNYFTAAGVYISSLGVGTGTDVTTGWTELTSTSVAPATAAFASVVTGITDAAQAAAEVHYVDRVSLVEAAEVWTMNGSAWDWVQAA